MSQPQSADSLAGRVALLAGASSGIGELDVTDESACREVVQRTRTELGGLDVLVNSAGLMLLGPIIDTDTEDWRRTAEP